jgi:hypothetical protein
VRAFTQVLLGAILVTALVGSCSRGTDAVKKPRAEGTPTERDPTCPAQAKAGALLPNTEPALETLAYWLGRSTALELDEVLLDREELAVHDAALRQAPDGALRIVDLRRAPSSDELRRALTERLAGYAKQLTSGQYVTDRANAARELAPEPSAFVEQRELRVALAAIDLHCVPFADAIRSSRGSEGVDRNRCSQARAQEPIELLGKLGDMRLARTANAFGFVAPDAPLSPPVPAELATQYRAGADLTLSSQLELAGKVVPMGTLLRAADGRSAWLASEREFVRSRPLTADEASATSRALTMRSFLTEAFRYVRSPYGWGDLGGGRDCSRFVLDVLASFGLGLPRTSAHQSQSGRYTVDVPTETSDIERLALLDEARERGVVLVHFPGHIMFYLGRDQAGTPRVLHSFAEYLAPCPGGKGETLVEVGRVAVSDLTLGKGTSRKSFLERITHLTVFGKDPGYELLALSHFRAPVAPTELAGKSCKAGRDTALYRSPREPDASRPLRIVAVSEQDIRPARVWLVSPDGSLIAPDVHDLGVGPYARWIEQLAPTPGKWRALVADGTRVLSCEEFRVASARTGSGVQPAARADKAPAWKASHQWDRASEQLYAAFVEQLFSHPVEDLRSWSSLSELLQKPERNLLFDHRGYGEDTTLALAPDCADLPYLLRGYFAWKVGLPFAFRHCTRGRAGVPPRCDDIITNELAVAANSELEAFQAFWKELTNGVHSASGRTLPEDPKTDLYPVALDRRALPPGTVFTDPYGHMIVLAKWLPQGLAGDGMLMGADAQPDATVGRRRFWRGNFLFTPETRDVGAGFKTFRPIIEDRKSRTLSALDNEAIAKSGEFLPLSRVQYTGKMDDFYARMDELVYPRPVAVLDRMKRVVDALREQVERRVEAVDVGEAGLRDLKLPIDMPEGYAIFETSGPWEDFATPSRDLRLLIAIDAVRGFPAQVREHPERFGVSAGDRALSEVDRLLEQQLKTQRFSYTRSDGSKFELSLADVVARVAHLETGYNPNDCVESRWGAPANSSEHATCKRSAPAAQRALMEQYRSWFHERARPPRPPKP